MKSFNVLDRSLSLYESRNIAASAGTGKTFAIEHLALRFLIENMGEDRPCFLEELLIVTFTRTAAKELKFRIFQTLEKALKIISEWLKGKETQTSIDFLLALKEKGEQTLQDAKFHLETALRSKDKNAILTIHGFAFKMLKEFAYESKMKICPSQMLESVDQESLDLLFEDFLKLYIHEGNLSASQLSLLLSKNSKENLKKTLLEIAETPYEICEIPNFVELFEQFQMTLLELQDANLDSEKILQDTEIFCLNRSRKADKRPLFRVCKLVASLFDESKNKLDVFEDLILENEGVFDFSTHCLKAKEIAKKTALYYPGIYENIQMLLKIVLEAAHKEKLLLHLAKGFKKLIQHKNQLDEFYFPDSLIDKLKQAAEGSDLKFELSNRFKAIIIDEFQDTDPRQWDLFKNLFLSVPKPPVMILVGDPKQSIYLFRNADIYTYLEAINTLPKENNSSLSRNFRSSKEFVKGLNLLFSEENVPHFFSLPRTGSTFPYELGDANPERVSRPFLDDKKPIHFCISTVTSQKRQSQAETYFEEELFLPFIAEEIIKLHTHAKIELKEIAILVHSHRQASDAASFLKKRGIACKLHKPKDLLDSALLLDLKCVLEALLNTKNENNVRNALATKLFGLSLESFEEMDDLNFLEDVYLLIESLKKSFFSDELGIFFDKLLNAALPNRLKNFERLIQETGGEEYLLGLELIMEILLEKEVADRLSKEALLDLLSNELFWKNNEIETRLKTAFASKNDAVIIETIHSSKGLEYEIVFALGLFKSSRQKDKFYPAYDEKLGFKLSLAEIQDPNYELYEKELEAEKTRQFYVAVTRTRERLYLPLPFFEKSNQSPIDIWLESLSQGIYGKESQNKKEILEHFLKIHQDCISSHELTPIASYSILENPVLEPLHFEQISTFEFKKREINSFTSLTKNLEKKPQEIVLEIKEKPLLPMGIETGIIIHDILENVPFNGLYLKETIERKTRGTKLYEFRLEIENMLLNAFNSKLLHFSLKDISYEKIIKELEFLHPEKTKDASEEFMQGAIDLIFFHDGLYYILDWKTNWLGNNKEDYSQEKLEEAMKKNSYDLQAKIYASALKKQLKLFDQRPFETIFGGTFYLFLRGAGFDDKTGVYFIPHGGKIHAG